MANRHRGEVDLALDGKTHALRLTLQALAEMEAAFAVEDLASLAERLSRGRLSAADLIRILGPALRGGGLAKSDAEIAAMLPAAALPQLIAAATAVLEATFGEAEENPPTPQEG